MCEAIFCMASITCCSEASVVVLNLNFFPGTVAENHQQQQHFRMLITVPGILSSVKPVTKTNYLKKANLTEC